MNRLARQAVMTGLALAAPSFLSAALAQSEPPRTPKNWSYEVDQRGNRIARNNRVTNPDGSWREEVRQGNCVTIKERSATGEYKESRQCNPAPPR
jgi:hypothetical protein